MSAPTVDEVDRIAGLADPILRNLQITQCYGEISEATARLIGIGANWCTFATWASKQAGQSIRREDLIQTLEDEIRRSPEFTECLERVIAAARPIVRKESAVFARAILVALELPDVAGRVADAVGRGNKKVFEEIGREFARFLFTFAGDDTYDPEKAERFGADLRPGDPPEGQRMLRDAFLAYNEARFRNDVRGKAELTFYANLLIGLHEQTRLQPEILEALSVGLGSPEHVRECLLSLLFPGFWLRIRYRLRRLLRMSLPLDDALDRLADHTMARARRTITHFLMTLHLPDDAILHLGADLPDGFPPTLLQITYPRLAALLLQVDVTPDSVQGSGALDWADLGDRMHFITDFFRTHHEKSSLRNPPFTAEQVAALKAGRIPEGPL